MSRMRGGLPLALRWARAIETRVVVDRPPAVYYNETDRLQDGRYWVCEGLSGGREEGACDSRPQERVSGQRAAPL